jgi:CopG family nickel-responsive transcriptional regulator
MERISITVEPELRAALDAWMARTGQRNRSEALRDLVRARLDGERLDAPGAEAVATLVFTHATDDHALAERLHLLLHARAGRTLAALHVHVDGDACLQMLALRGPAADLRAFADFLLGQPGVRGGHLHLIPVGPPR